MESTSFLVFCGFVVFSILIIIVVSIFGMKEKSYDEAVVEQRSKDQGNGLHLKNGKVNKNKKKKNSKKQKEKSVESEVTINVSVAKVKSKLSKSTVPLAEVKPLTVAKPVVLQTKNVNNKSTENEVDLKSAISKRIIKKDVIETDKEKGKNKKNANLNAKVESKPIKAEIKPLKSENKPLKSENKPLKSENKPLKSENKPLKTENKPLKTENKPLKTENKPLKSENKPLKSENKPLKSENKPLKSENKPLKSENKPLKSENKPLKSENKQLKSENKPLKSENKPLKSENKPLKSENKPLKSENKPLKSENKPTKNELKMIKNESNSTTVEGKLAKSDIKGLKIEAKVVKKEVRASVVNSKPVKAETKQKEVNAKVDGKGVKVENKSDSNVTKKTETRDSSQKNNVESQKKNGFASKMDESASVPQSPTKRAKKLKYDLSSGDNGMNGIHLATVLRNAILTDAELQTLIEILLNRQQEGESWIKMGQKIDPLSALKKQLQESEQKLADEQMTSQTTSNKLKEVRQELTKTIQLERSIREKFVSQQQELQNLQMHYQHQHDQHVSEINGLQIKFQQVQVKTSEDHRLALQHVQDENEKLKQALAQMEATSKSVTSNEINRLQCELEQWRLTCEQYKEQLASSQQTDNERQQHIHQLQQCIQDLKNKAGQQEKATNDLLKQLSQLESNRSALQRDLGLYQNVQTENNSLHNTIRDMEKTNNNFCQRIQELEDQVHNEETKMIVCIKANDAKQQEVEHKLEQVHQNNEMMKMKIEDMMKDTIAKESLLAKQENDLAQYLDEVQQVTKELNIQRDKNNELRRKNWKAMETLNKTEKLAEDRVNKKEKIIGEINRVLSRFIPETNYDINEDFSIWLKQFEEIIKLSQSAANLKEELTRVKQTAEESEKTLNSQVKHYQEVLRDTESMLNKLQRRAEEEELIWKEKLEYTENDLKQYEEKLEELQGRLLIEENERKLCELKGNEAVKSLKNLQETIEKNTTEIAKYQELEISFNKRMNELETKLEVEKKNVKDLTSQAVKLNSLVRIGEASLKAEQDVVRELQKKIADQKTLTATSNGTSDNTIHENMN